MKQQNNIYFVFHHDKCFQLICSTKELLRLKTQTENWTICTYCLNFCASETFSLPKNSGLEHLAYEDRLGRAGAPQPREEKTLGRLDSGLSVLGGGLEESCGETF